MRTTLRLIVPGLIDPVPYLKELPAQDLPELPVFSSFLSRGKYISPETCDTSNNNLYTCIFDQFPWQTHFQQPPIASLSYFFDIKSRDIKNRDLKNEANDNEDLLPLEALKDKWLMRLDPCFMVPDRDQLVLAQIGNFDISLQESEQLAEEINQFFNDFKEDNFWTIKVVSAERWYLVSDRPIDIETVPPEKVIGQSVKSYLLCANTKESRYWLNLFNEFQMILHQSPINKLRRENNKVPINSLWFWGQDRNSDLLNSFFYKGNVASDVLLYADNIVVQGPALVSGGECSSVPDNYSLISNAHERNVICILDDFSRVIQNKDIFSWVGLLEQFEINYLHDILKDLDAGKLFQLELVSPTGRRLIVTKKLLRRWWRKKKNFTSFYHNNS